MVTGIVTGAMVGIAASFAMGIASPQNARKLTRFARREGKNLVDLAGGLFSK